MSHMLFVNLAVRDLERTKAFFRELGFDFNPQFTDETAACMPLNEGAFVMLLTEPKFREFTRNRPCDTSTHTEALLALSVDSREAVDRMVETVEALGGREAMPPQDHGFMYQRSFYDLDGHGWQVMWMDPAAAEQGPEAFAASTQDA